MGDVIVSMEHITKEFPGVKALDDVKFNLRAGEVMALLGENGAGKSTLMENLEWCIFSGSGKFEDIWQRLFITYSEFSERGRSCNHSSGTEYV